MSRTVNEAELMSFVGLAGFFEEFFISAPAADENPLFSRRFIPGQLTLVLAEGLYILTGRLHNGLALLGLSAMTWTQPVACGDTIQAQIVVEESRPTSQAGRGIVTTSHHVVNQGGQEVLTYESVRMIRARS